jgi:hypothetical protein
MNDRYSELRLGSLAAWLTGYMRRKMFAAYVASQGGVITNLATVLDIGATSDRDFADSNYFEHYYPYPQQITALGYADAAFLQEAYDGLQFVRGDGCHLPFADHSFDMVHSGAVLEHVGNRARQQQFLHEAIRVARHGIFITTPNRCFPMELHTGLPLIHWLPATWFRWLLRWLGKNFYAQECNLNLLSKRDIAELLKTIPNIHYRFVPMRLCGFTSNILIYITRLPQ